MAEIIDTSSYRGQRGGQSGGQAYSWIVMFNDLSDEQGRQAHIDLVKRLNEHQGGIKDTMHYPGVQHVYEHLKGYAGVFRQNVVEWIRSQGDIASIEPDAPVILD